MLEFLFSYGTLQKKQVQIKLFGRVVPMSPDTLRAYQIVPLEITDGSFLAGGEDKDQFTLIPTKNQNDLIRGHLLELTEAELLTVDKYEPANYRRIRVILDSGTQAWVYIVGS